MFAVLGGVGGGWLLDARCWMRVSGCGLNRSIDCALDFRFASILGSVWFESEGECLWHLKKIHI